MGRCSFLAFVFRFGFILLSSLFVSCEIVFFVPWQSFLEWRSCPRVGHGIVIRTSRRIAAR